MFVNKFDNLFRSSSETIMTDFDKHIIIIKRL